MKYSINLFLLSIFLSCGSVNTNKNTSKKVTHEIVEIPFIEKDTVYLNELRFYEVSSAKSVQQVMYDYYGKWDKKIVGKHQKNINQLIWDNIDLLENKSSYTVITDGTETTKDYYASIMIFDNQGNDCLKEAHPLKNTFIKILTHKMASANSKSDFYKL